MSKLSPMMQQYLDIKSDHQDHVLFFRLGDFYEMFFDDAIRISKELELTLTGRDCGMPERAPMCGIPFHSSETYIKKLINKGYKVAICEQTEDPSQAKGIVKREVIRVVTPGTVIEGNLLSEEKNNYIACVISDKTEFAVCFADVSTGDLYLSQQQTKNMSNDIINEISKFTPSEILLNNDLLNFKAVTEFIQTKINCVADLIDDEKLNYEQCKQLVLNHFNVDKLEQLNIQEKPMATTALGAVISYLNSTQKDGAKRIVKINLYKENEYMSIDITARRNLEITETMRTFEKKGTLLWILDKTKTAMGKRFIRKALEQPLISIAKITRRQKAVGEIISQTQMRDELTKLLSSVYDLERLMTRVLYQSVNPRELKSLAFTASHLPSIKQLTQNFKSTLLIDLNSKIDILDEIKNLIDNAIEDEPPFALKDGGVIKSGFNQELDEYRDICNNAKSYIAKIEEKEKEKTGIKNLKINYNRVFGYYIEVTKSYLNLVPDEYIRKQTLANCERYITQELKELEAKVLSANDKIQALETEIFNEVRRFVATKIDTIQQTASAIAELDFINSLAIVGAANNYICPEITLSGEINIKDGRHPVVEAVLNDSLFVPNDTMLDKANNRMVIITGPNMAGKSTYMRQVAILTIMAQIGSFVPATSATISICDKIFTRVGASDDLSAGQSTFMVEMSEVAHILKNATPNSLVILDEIGRGTSTYDGMSIAKAVVEFMSTNKNLKCKTMFATHYHELTELEQELDGVKNYNIAVKKRGDDITFLRKIVRGGADESFGIEVAKLAGVPQDVVNRAKEILAGLEQNDQAIVFKKSEAPHQETQISFLSTNSSILTQKLNEVQIDTLTPIEALNMLYELKKIADSMK